MLRYVTLSWDTTVSLFSHQTVDRGGKSRLILAKLNKDSFYKFLHRPRRDESKSGQERFCVLLFAAGTGKDLQVMLLI